MQTFEGGQKPPHPNSIAAMRRAIEDAGVKLIFDRNGMAARILRQDADLDPSGDASA